MKQLCTILTFLCLMLQQALALELELPIACSPGVNCWIQQYPDHDPGPAASDYTCGSAAYDTHDGTDFRIPALTASVAVLAAADGRVKGLRDGVADRIVKTDADRALVRNIECGNGVVLAHPGGWETQYCHMRKGSISVRAGDMVKAGTKLGDVGYSGDAGFAHLHLSVRHNGRKIDPFSGPLDKGCGTPDKDMWSKRAAHLLPYAGGGVIAFQWAPAPLSLDAMSNGEAEAASPAATWPAMVAHVLAINLRKGDEMKLVVEGPQGALASNIFTLEKNMAQQMILSGKKQPPAGWPTGIYAARLTVTRQGKPLIDRVITTTLE